MGGPGSGRKRKLPSAAQTKALYHGIDLSTPEGVRVFVVRVQKLALSGAIPNDLFKTMVASTNTVKNAGAEERFDKRTRDLLAGIAELIATRAAGSASARDVGPPKDDGPRPPGETKH